MADRGEDAAKHLRKDQVGQRQPVRREKGDERIAAALEGSKPKADGRAEHDPVSSRVPLDPDRDEQQRQNFRELLDQADTDVDKRAVLQQPCLQKRSRKHAEHASVKEGDEDTLRRNGGAGQMIEVVDDRGRRDQKAADEDDSWDQVGVSGQTRHQDGKDPQNEAAEEHQQPSPALAARRRNRYFSNHFRPPSRV